MSARTARELAALLHDIDSLRIDYRHGRKSADEVDRAIRRMLHGAVTLERAAASYERVVSRNTARRVRSWIAGVGAPLARLDVHDLDGPRLGRWIAQLVRLGYERSSIDTAWRTLRALVRYATELGWIARCPWGTWKPSRRGSVRRARLREAARTPGELAQLLAGARLIDAEQRGRGRLGGVEAKIACAALLGLRQGELAGLLWSDVQWPTVEPLFRGAVAIVRQYAGAELKAGPWARLEPVGELFAILADHRLLLEQIELYRTAGPLFPWAKESTRGSPRPYASGECLTRGDLRSAVRKSGLPSAENWSPHSLRDSFATLEQDGARGDLRALAARTRHASLSSLVRYLRERSREPAPPGFALHSPAPSLLPSPHPHKEPR